MIESIEETVDDDTDTTRFFISAFYLQLDDDEDNPRRRFLGCSDLFYITPNEDGSVKVTLLIKDLVGPKSASRRN